MSISNILARKTVRNRTRQQSMKERHDYDQKAEKTLDGDLISAYMCSPETAAEEFEISKRLYYQLTERSQPKKRDVLMYRVIQSFQPGEVTPEEAHKIAYELAMKLTKGQHQFVICTHVDRAHIHSHIEFNSTDLDCTGKFHVHQSARLLQRLNDEICRAHGLSVIEQKQQHSKTPGEAAAIKHGFSWKEQLRQTIDRALSDCGSYEEFLARMRSEGYEIKEGKQLSFRAPGQERFTRSFRLGDDYTKEALRDRFGHRRGQSMPQEKPVQWPAGGKINLLVDIRKKMAEGKGPGYEHWAKIFNLKEAAKTLNFLVDNNLTDYDLLTAKAEQAEADFDQASHRIKQLEAKMAEVAQLKTQIAALAEKGTVNFLSGMAEGTDLICAEIVLALRQKNPAIKLHCILPFVGQSNKWSAFSRERYQAVLAQADSIIYVSRSYNRNCYLARNRFLVDYSSVLLAVYNGSTRSGTGMTVRYARKLGREIFVIDPASLQVTHEKQGVPV